MRFSACTVCILCCGLAALAGRRAGAQPVDWSKPAPDARYAAGREAAGQSPTAPATAQQSGPQGGGGQSGEGGQSNSGLTPIGADRTPSRAKVSKGSGSLPREHGQVWREYDIRPYTLRVAGEERPEQVIVDWVLRETGYEAWHSEPLGILSATRDTLRVYHTPEMQGLVADIVDRFVNSQTDSKAFALRIATVRNPNWRANAMPLMTPIPVQSPGMQGWILPKENAALLLSYLTRRADFREHAASNQLVPNGRSVVLSTMRPRQYVKGIVRTQNTWPGFQPETGTLEEGASMEFSPLLSLDSSTADAVVKIRINQVEKMQQVRLDIPTAMAGPQRMEVEVPQITMASVHERFRWPADHVLLLSMGVIAPPTPDKGNQLINMIPGVNAPPRADGLLFIEVKDTSAPASTPGGVPATAQRAPGSFSGRY